MIDTTTALEARANLEWVAGKWGELKNRLHRSGGDPNAPKVTGSTEPAAPIDLHVSDLMHEIEQEAVLWGRILIEETDWRQEHGEMPGLLLDVAEQYGHFVCDQDEKVAYDFCDTAGEFRRKVEGVLSPPDPRRYVGPCFEGACQAELHIRESIEGGLCPECLTPWTLEGQFRSAEAEMRTLLMEKPEIVRALKILGYEIRPNLIHEWTSGNSPRLKAKEEGLYRLFDAVELVRNKGKRRARPPMFAT